MTMDYKISRMDFSNSEDLDKLICLQNTVYEGKHIFTENSFKHWYLDNPNGRVVSYNALCGGSIVAHYALIPIKMNFDGDVQPGLLSMATVTHPEHRGKGLFKTLAKTSFEYAVTAGYKFVIGVANANSFPGFVKYFDFKEISKLDVLIGTSNEIEPDGDRKIKIYWDEAGYKWRIGRMGYSKDMKAVYGTKSFWKFKKAPLIKTFLGCVDRETLKKINIPHSNISRPFNLYVGLGSNACNIGYKKLPSFIEHSPFHLIYMDLTKGTLPEVNKDNFFFQLMDFDVA